jgi:hypothetical protein
MSDRTTEQLSHIIELHQRQIALQEKNLENQRIALAGQQESLQIQRVVFARQRRWLNAIGVLTALMLLAFLLPYAYQWYRYLSHRP